ncbi:MAG: energy-coupling factor transporter transmembrane protein EcfT [Clostridiales bacterium]|nr:energy-coupling factor transporter transmembrane protein EcfT [Clostridiales bacterium]
MLNNISLGRYVDTGSVLHRTDPRIKVILYIVYLICIFAVDSLQALIALSILTVVQLVVARMPLNVTWSTVKPILPLTLFIFILNLFTIKTGNTLFSWRFILITDVGLTRAILMSLRLLFLILSTSVLLTLTTTPLKIADALESLLSPLKAIHVPVHEASMMMSIALRFIPTLIEETDKIMRAQESRGADYDTGSFINRVKGYVTVLIPLFVSSFKRAEDLAVAMDARCYRGGNMRTKLNPLRITGSDILVFIAFLMGAALLILTEVLLGG